MSRLEMVTLLCMGDKTHSQLMELMPERCGTTQNRDFESVLADVCLLTDHSFNSETHSTLFKIMILYSILVLII